MQTLPFSVLSPQSSSLTRRPAIISESNQGSIMRAGLGLVGLLICIGVIVWIMHSAVLPHTEATLQAKKKAEDTLNPIAGYSRDGSMRFSDSLKLQGETKGGKIAAVDVISVVPGGPAET